MMKNVVTWTMKTKHQQFLFLYCRWMHPVAHVT
jgi:hypothetical protein